MKYLNPLQDDPNFQFQDGDIAEFGGIASEVTKHASTIAQYVVHHKGTSQWFTLDGRYKKEHTKPTLFLVERPKKKRTVRFYQWFSKDKQGSYLHICPNMMSENLEHLDGRVSSYKHRFPEMVMNKEVFIDLEVEW